MALKLPTPSWNTGMSFEILYRGDHFDEEAYRNIFQKLQEENYFDFRIEYRRFSDH